MYHIKEGQLHCSQEHRDGKLGVGKEVTTCQVDITSDLISTDMEHGCSNKSCQAAMRFILIIQLGDRII
jgi:hypothetical protein